MIGLHGGAISALTVDQVYSGGQETRIRARKGSGLVKIAAMQGVAPPDASRGSYWKSTSQARVAERFRPWPLIKCIEAVQKHQSAWGKVLPMPKYQCCKAEQHIEISASLFSDSS